MKKYILKIASIIVFAFLLLSCNDFLNVNNRDAISSNNYYKSKADLEAALNGVYATLGQNATYRGYMLGRMGLDADQGYNNRDGDLNSVGDYTVNANDTKVLQFWQTLYAGINDANMLLENVDNPEIEIEQKERDRIKGEGLFLRGYYYFLLVQNFGDVPLILESTSVKSSHEKMNPSRTDKKIIYDKIIEDMEGAVDLVYDIDRNGNGGRVSKSAIWGVLARVHLNIAGYPIQDKTHYKKARTCALQVINSGLHDLNPSFQQIFINYARDIYDIKESIWEVEFYGNGEGIYANLGGFVGGNNGIRNTFDLALGYTYDYINATISAYEVYESNDLRRDHTIAPFYYSQAVVPTYKINWSSTQIFNRNCGKFRREYEILEPKHRSRTPQNFPLLRYSDVLLMFAEAENEINGNPTAEALEAVNKVRRRGYGVDINTPDSNIDINISDYKDFQEFIYDERSRELAYECLRKGDLVRWGNFYSKMKKCLPDASAAPSFGDKDHAVATFTNVGERDVLWPIPNYEIGLNPNLTQNAGW